MRAQVTYRGVGFGGLLTLIFAVAKLWDHIDWPWVWVCSPLWIPAGIFVAVCAVLLIVAGLVFAFAGILDGVSSRKPKQKKVAR